MAVEVVHGDDYRLRVLPIEDLQDEDDKLKSEIYRAVCHQEDGKVIEHCNDEIDKVIELCNKTRYGPFYKIGLHGSTVLHLACFLENFTLADKLLDKAFEDTSSEDELYDLLATQNSWGNTILHDAATSDEEKGIQFVKKLLNKVPRLLEIPNKWGEYPLITAIRYGKKDMYKYLVEKIRDGNYEWEKHLKRDHDNMTILHMAILTREFSVARDIAKRYPELSKEEDNRKRSALHMLAKSPTAFKNGTQLSRVEKLVYKIVSTNDQDTTSEVGMTGKSICSILGRVFSTIEKVRKLKKDNEDALKLAKMLIQEDFSWKKTFMPLTDNLDDIKSENETPQKEGMQGEDDHSAPLHVAAKNGCIEIVEKILNVHPQAVDYLNRKQENLFHVAIRSRNQEIIKIVEKNNLLKRGQLIAVDKDYNTIMHKVGEKPFTILGKDKEDTKTKILEEKPEAVPEEAFIDKEIKTPFRELSDELNLLEELEGRCPDYLVYHRNKDNLTARELFTKKNAKLREDAKEYLKTTAEHCTAVTALIATVAFTAAYTVPGGPNEQTGLPVLLGQPLFLIFTITDVLSLGFGLTAVVFFLTILTSQFRMKDFQRALPLKLLLGFTLLFLSVTMMMISFAATILLTINTKHDWTKIALYIVAFLPVLIFIMFNFRLYKELFRILRDYGRRKRRKHVS